MIVRSGKLCSSHINGRSALASSAVARNPTNGTALTEGHAWSYQSRAGFTGEDAFAIQLTGTSYHKGRSGGLPINGTTVVNVAVRVVP